MTTEPILLKLAKQGDARAISALINAALKSQEIRVKPTLAGQCLQVMLQSPRLLNQQTSIAFLRRATSKLRFELFKLGFLLS